MPLDQSFNGRTYPPTPPYQVGREKIREFAVAVGARDPLHHDVEAAKAAGYPDLVATPTFLAVLTMQVLVDLVLDPDLGIDYSRVVHGDQVVAPRLAVQANFDVAGATGGEVQARVRFVAELELKRGIGGLELEYLDDLFVDPDHRGTGIVEALYDAMRAIAAERGWPVIRWTTDDANYRARAVYDKLATRTMWITYDMATT